MADPLAVSIGLIAVLVAGAVYRGENRRTDLEVARNLHLDLTSGEVTEARRLLGTLRYGDEPSREGVDPRDALTAYFTLLWCFERIAAGRRGLAQGPLLGRQSRALMFLDDVIRWHLVEWRLGVPLAKVQIGARLGEAIDDHQSREALRGLLVALQLEGLSDEMFEDEGRG